MKKRWIIISGFLAVAVLYILFVVSELQTVSSIGVVKPRNIQNIMVDFPAHIEKIYVSNGQKVKAGEILVSLNINEFESELKSKAQDLKKAQNDLQQEQAGIQQLESDKMGAEETLKKGQKELKDKEALFKQGAVSQYELDEYRKTVRLDQKAVSDLMFSLAAKTQGTSSMDVKKEKVASLEQELLTLQNKLTLSCIRNGDIVSPFGNGVVCEIGYNPGDKIHADKDDKKVLCILDLNSLYVEVQIAENMIKYVRTGAKVKLTPIADPSRNYQGKVTKLSDMAVTKNGETFFSVEVEVRDRDRFLVPNLNMDVKIYKNRLF